MPARQSRTRPTTASTLCETTTLVPVVSAIVVSGLDSTVTMRSGLRWNDSCSEPRRWSSIMVQLPLGLAVEVDQVLQHLVGGRDDARVGLEATLRGDHVRELGREVDVRHLDGASHREAVGPTRGRDVLRARVGTGGPGVVAEPLERALVLELREREVARGHTRATTGRLVGHRAVLADRDVARAGRDLDQRVGTGTTRGGAAYHVLAFLRGHVALVVGREVAGARVLERGRHCRCGRGADPEPAVARDRDVERVAGGLESTTAHQVVDRADLRAEA